MAENDILLNISKLKTVKIKVIVNASINFLAQHIEKAIKHADFFDIDYEKYGKDIISKADIPQNEKDKIHEMFKNPPQENSQSSNINPQINQIESSQSPSNLHSLKIETQLLIDININSDRASNSSDNEDNNPECDKDNESSCNEDNNSTYEEDDDNNIDYRSDITEYIDADTIDLESFCILEKNI